jgi:hypothetical protein
LLLCSYCAGGHIAVLRLPDEVDVIEFESVQVQSQSLIEGQSWLQLRCRKRVRSNADRGLMGLSKWRDSPQGGQSRPLIYVPSADLCPVR